MMKGWVLGLALKFTQIFHPIHHSPKFADIHRRNNRRDRGRLVPQLLGWGPTVYWSTNFSAVWEIRVCDKKGTSKIYRPSYIRRAALIVVVVVVVVVTVIVVL